MAEPQRIPPEEVRNKVRDGLALLVCAYEDRGKFENLLLEGAISIQAFRERLPDLPRDQEIIFYCA